VTFFGPIGCLVDLVIHVKLLVGFRSVSLICAFAFFFCFSFLGSLKNHFHRNQKNKNTKAKAITIAIAIARYERKTPRNKTEQKTKN